MAAIASKSRVEVTALIKIAYQIDCMEKQPVIHRVGGPSDRTSDRCDACKELFAKVRFAHYFKTGRGGINACDHCAKDLYGTVLIDVGFATLEMARELDEIWGELARLKSTGGRRR